MHILDFEQESLQESATQDLNHPSQESEPNSSQQSTKENFTKDIQPEQTERTTTSLQLPVQQQSTELYYYNWGSKEDYIEAGMILEEENEEQERQQQTVVGYAIYREVPDLLLKVITHLAFNEQEQSPQDNCINLSHRQEVDTQYQTDVSTKFVEEEEEQTPACPQKQTHQPRRKKIWKCTNCRTICSTQGSFTNHVKCKHYGTKKEDKCPKDLNIYDYLDFKPDSRGLKKGQKVIRKTEPKDAKFKCNKCGKSLSSSHTLKVHKQKKHQDEEEIENSSQKQRGRPPKSAKAERAYIIKRGRGRPRKNKL